MFDIYQIADQLNQLLINPRDDSLGRIRIPYLIFNSVEALCWLVVAVAIFWRYWKHRKSSSEIGYSMAFLAFALSDMIETSGTTLMLLLFKGACLLAIHGYRSWIRPLYGSRLI